MESSKLFISSGFRTNTLPKGSSFRKPNTRRYDVSSSKTCKKKNQKSATVPNVIELDRTRLAREYRYIFLFVFQQTNIEYHERVRVRHVPFFPCIQHAPVHFSIVFKCHVSCAEAQTPFLWISYKSNDKKKKRTLRFTQSLLEHVMGFTL